MNCNPCCGCCPPITTYNPSVADNFPTILQQVEYLKALLKKYPSQQWFITQEKVTEETVKLDSTKVSLRGRAIAEGDFILGNTIDGTTLMFQYTGATVEVTYYVVEYIGVYSNQAEAQEALQRANGANELAGQALSLAQTNEKDIGVLDGQIAELEQNKVDKIKSTSKYIQIYGVSKQGEETTYELSEEVVPWKIVRRNGEGNIKSNSAIENNDVVINEDFKRELNNKQDKLDINSVTGVKSMSANTYMFRNFINNDTFYQRVIVYNDGKQSGDFNVASNDNFKTLFGNKSIIGKGNIDLYHHEISYGTINDGITIVVYFEHYSSNNLNVDSLADVKTLLGNTFKKEIFGSITNTATGKALTPLYINETNIFYIGEDGSVQNQILSGTFTDTVKTI